MSLAHAAPRCEQHFSSNRCSVLAEPPITFYFAEGEFVSQRLQVDVAKSRERCIRTNYPTRNKLLDGRREIVCVPGLHEGLPFESCKLLVRQPRGLIVGCQIVTSIGFGKEQTGCARFAEHADPNIDAACSKPSDVFMPRDENGIEPFSFQEAEDSLAFLLQFLFNVFRHTNILSAGKLSSELRYFRPNTNKPSAPSNGIKATIRNTGLYEK